MSKLLGKLTKEQFLTWQLGCEQMRRANAEHVSEQRYFEMIKKDIEIATLKANIFKAGSVEQKRVLSVAVKNSYDEMLKKMAEEAGFPIAGHTIDDVTLEVTDYSDEDQK